MTLAINMKSFVTDASFAGFDETTPVRKVRERRSDLVSYGTFKEQRNIISSRPRRHWFINWSLLDKAGRDKLIEMHDAGEGRAQEFWWLDSDEFLATAQTITTSGTAITFQLINVYRPGKTYTWTENKNAIVPSAVYAPVVTHSIDGAQTEVAAAPGANQYVLDDDTGIMTWGAATPPSAGTLTCTFQYYFRVRFAQDTLEDLMIHTRLYSNPELHIVEVVS